MEPLDNAEVYEVVLIRDGEDTLVYSGTLEDCEDWLALNGDAWDVGHFEIRPALEPSRG